MHGLERPALPKLLQKRRNKKILSRVIPCFILLVACIVILVAWGERLFRVPNNNVVLQKALYAVFLLLPFIITGVPNKLIDSSWSGVVLAVKVTDGIGTYSRHFGKSAIYSKQDIILTVLKDDGKKIKYTAMSLGEAYVPGRQPPVSGNIQYQLEKFKAGTRVHKYYGFIHLFISPSHSDDDKACIACGATNRAQDTVCGLCRSELII